jgi:hypothetical protein
MKSRQQRGRSEGAAALEFAVILPLLLLILGGIIDYGLMFNAQIAVTHAGREGVRVEAIGSGDPVAAANAAFTAVPGVTSFEAIIDRSCPNVDGAEMTTQASFDPLILPIGSRLLRSEAVMRCNG